MHPHQKEDANGFASWSLGDSEKIGRDTLQTHKPLWRKYTMLQVLKQNTKAT